MIIVSMTEFFHYLKNKPFLYMTVHTLTGTKGMETFHILLVGMLLKDGVSVPEGYCYKDIEETDVAIGWIKGKNTADVCSSAHGAWSYTIVLDIPHPMKTEI